MIVDRWQRILGTGLSFALFGAGSLVLGVVGGAGLWLVTRDRERRERRFQRLVHWSFRGFARFMEAVGVIAVEFRNAEVLSGPDARLLIANHPTLIDYVLLVAKLPQADVVVKHAYFSNPFTAATVRSAGYVPNDIGDATVRGCAERIRAGRTVLLFPEGTRSPRHGLGPFQRGAAHVALATGVAALPVTITCEPRGLAGDRAWYDVPERRMQFVLDVGDPIPTPGDGGEPRGRASRRLTAQYREHFEKKLEHHHG